MAFQIRRTAVVVALAALAVASGGVPAAADTERGHRGEIGEHRLTDTEERRGARCVYSDGAGGGERVLTHLRVRPPVVFVESISPFVGWRVVLQRRLRSWGRWATF